MRYFFTVFSKSMLIAYKTESSISNNTSIYLYRCSNVSDNCNSYFSVQTD